MTNELNIPDVPEEIEYQKLCLEVAFLQNENLRGLSVKQLKEKGFDEFESAFAKASSVWKIVQEFNYNQLAGFHKMGLDLINASNADIFLCREITETKSRQKQIDTLEKMIHLDNCLGKFNLKETPFPRVYIISLSTLLSPVLGMMENHEEEAEIVKFLKEFVSELSSLLKAIKHRSIVDETLNEQGDEGMSKWDMYEDFESRDDKYDWDNSFERKVLNSYVSLIFRLIIKK